MGNLKAMIPILLALAIAIAGTVLLYRWIQGQTAPKEMVKVDTEAVPVVVAAVDIPRGAKLTSEMIRKVAFLKESLPSGYFSSIKKVSGRVAIASMRRGEPVVAYRLAPVDVKSGGVSVLLPPGKRAVAVKGDKVIGISGFINPGDRVDVLVTLRDPKKKMEVTKIVLENVPVLATGTQMQQDENGKPAPVDVYTLEVTPDESERLALAAAEGKLQFALRNMLDSETVRTPGTTIPQTLSALLAKADPAPRLSRRHTGKVRRHWVRRRTAVVEVIRGNDVSKKVVRVNANTLKGKDKEKTHVAENR